MGGWVQCPALETEQEVASCLVVLSPTDPESPELPASSGTVSEATVRSSAYLLDEMLFSFSLLCLHGCLLLYAVVWKLGAHSVYNA